MKICVLQPDYSTSAVDYKTYDPPRNLSCWYPQAQVDHIFLNKLTTYKQLKELKQQQYDCYVNLCEGYLEWEVPSIDVIYSLEQLNLPYTGPNLTLYDPPKELMKYVAYTEGIKTPSYAIVHSDDDAVDRCKQLQYPLFVKPSKAGDSLGVDEQSLVNNREELVVKIENLFKEFDEVIVEEFISGREFTILIAAGVHHANECRIYQPVEFVFPAGSKFKTYALKTSALHPGCNIPCMDAVINEELKQAARKIFTAFNGVGYARMDFRMNNKNELFFLEVNFTSSVFYSDGYEGSADYILKYDEAGHAGFLRHIVDEAIARHKRRQKKFVLKSNAIAGFGIYSSQPVAKGEVIFKGEEMSQRMVTKPYVDEYWNEHQKKLFAEYAYPAGSDVYVLWSNDPADWAPQNHSCNANCCYVGLNVIATRSIEPGEELTLDYTTFLDKEAKPFTCTCGALNCKGLITGRGKSIRSGIIHQMINSSLQ